MSRVKPLDAANGTPEATRYAAIDATRIPAANADRIPTHAARIPAYAARHAAYLTRITGNDALLTDNSGCEPRRTGRTTPRERCSANPD